MISSAADNLADGVVAGEPQVKRYGSVIRRESWRLAEMVEQLLRFSGLQSGRARYTLQPVDAEKAIEKALPRDLKEEFLKTREMIEPILAEPPTKGEKGRMIFASAPQGFLEFYRVGTEVEPIVVWDSSPFLLPLARLKGDYEDYGLLLLDSQEARLFLVRSGILEEKDRAKIDLMNKHKKGGWSQMRYNRLRRGAIKSFLARLIDDLQSHEDLPRMRGLVVAGPGEAKHQFVEMLPSALKEKVLGTVDLDMETPAGCVT